MLNGNRTWDNWFFFSDLPSWEAWWTYALTRTLTIGQTLCTSMKWQHACIKTHTVSPAVLPPSDRNCHGVLPSRWQVSYTYLQERPQIGSKSKYIYCYSSYLGFILWCTSQFVLVCEFIMLLPVWSKQHHLYNFQTDLDKIYIIHKIMPFCKICYWLRELWLIAIYIYVGFTECCLVSLKLITHIHWWQFLSSKKNILMK